MIVALLTLSLAMIGGGLMAMVLGWDIVLNERGWSMVIAGSVAMSGGAILLGIVAVIARLARIQTQLVSLGVPVREADLPLPPSPVIDPVSLLASGLLVGLPPDTQATDKADEPTLPLFGTDKEAASEAPPTTIGGAGERDGEEKDALAPLPLRFADDETADAEIGPEAPEDLLAEPDIKAVEADKDLLESIKPEWARDGESELPKPDWAHDRSEDKDQPEDKPDDAMPKTPESASSAAAPGTDGPAPGSAVIGTYNSGNNRYVMFADGSIEAQTPEGVFKFASLDELKEFIASGGESGSAGA